MKPTQLKYSCFSNIGNFYRAIEKYNTDHTSKINKMDKDTYNILVDNKYIKPITLPLSLCEYVSKGDLATDTGIIYCECHGDLDGKIKGKYSESEIDKAYVVRDKQRLKKALSDCGIVLIITVMFVLIGRFMFPKFLKSLVKFVIFIVIFFILLFVLGVFK